MLFPTTRVFFSYIGEGKLGKIGRIGFSSNPTLVHTFSARGGKNDWLAHARDGRCKVGKVTISGFLMISFVFMTQALFHLLPSPRLASRSPTSTPAPPQSQIMPPKSSREAKLSEIETWFNDLSEAELQSSAKLRELREIIRKGTQHV